jgi:hypothetical protein
MITKNSVYLPSISPCFKIQCLFQVFHDSHLRHQWQMSMFDLLSAQNQTAWFRQDFLWVHCLSKPDCHQTCHASALWEGGKAPQKKWIVSYLSMWNSLVNIVSVWSICYQNAFWSVNHLYPHHIQSFNTLHFNNSGVNGRYLRPTLNTCLKEWGWDLEFILKHSMYYNLLRN